MASEDLTEGRPAYGRFLILLFGEAAVGLFLYVAFAFMPIAVQALVFLTAIVIAISGSPKANEEKSLASLLCAYTAVFIRICVICIIVFGPRHSRISRNDIEFRLVFVGVCLVAGLRILDRRVSFRE